MRQRYLSPILLEKFQCYRVCFEIHTIVQILSNYGCRSKGMNKYFYVGCFHLGGQRISNHHSCEGDGCLPFDGSYPQKLKK